MLSSLVCCNWHSCSKFITSSMVRPLVSSMKTFSRFPSAIILLYTKSITVPVCRPRLDGYLLRKLGLAVNQTYLCRGTQYGAVYGKVKDYTKILWLGQFPSVTIPPPPPGICRSPGWDICHQWSAQGWGICRRFLSTIENFTFLLFKLNFCLFY